ncbi:MAG: UTP--glucose-1-phosphate uridylyltransferase [Proteobacteria bacterium]|jgi:UTP--glucose-1-phosphate uridylyltransferase|nr:UTP--glucose-1-phosphate uridylyltransferase [Pseudomonadota bacterium]
MFKGVIIAAGYGTRFLPVTRVVPKELLPLIDRPAIDFVAQELIEAGVDDILVISSRRKKALEDWFDREIELERLFLDENNQAKLAKIAPPAAQAHFVRQTHFGGTGHALLLARSFVGDHPFVVAYPDDIFPEGCTKRLIDIHRQTGHCVLAAADMTGRDVSRYGVIDCDDEGRVRQIIEKPAPGEEPSKLVSLGRYLYTPQVFDLLEEGMRHHGDGEFYPMDAINELARQGKVRAAVMSGPHWDIGEPLGYLKAVVEVALERPEFRDDFTNWLRQRLG